MAAPGRRRAALLALGVVVGVAHWAAALWLPRAQLGDGDAARMPRRLEVTYVRDLLPAAPPPPPPAARRPPRPRAGAARPQPAASAASAAPSDANVVAEAPAPPAEEAPSPLPPASAALAADAPASEAAASAAVAAASAASAATATAFEWPPSTRLTYALSGNYRGEVSGGAMVEWVRVGTRYQVHLDVWVGAQAAPLVGRRMTSDGDLTEDGLVPRRYDEETRALFRELRRRTIRFEADRVLLPNGRTPERPLGVQDAASQFVQLTWLFTTRPELLKVGNSVDLTLALPTKVDSWTYDVVGTATLPTPVGPVETFHMKPRRPLRPGTELVAEAWFAPALMYLPVRLLIRQDEATYVDMVLDQAPQQEAARPAPSVPQ